MKLKGYPTIRLFKGENKTSTSDYEGDRSKDDILRWISQHTGTPIPQTK